MYLLNNNDLTVSEVEMTTFRSINWREVDVEELLRKNIVIVPNFVKNIYNCQC